MFELVIILCRYLFLFYIVFFLCQSFAVIFTEQKLIHANIGSSLSNQRIVIIFFHITAFLILSYKPNTFSFDIKVMLNGILGLLYFLMAYIAIEKFYKKSCPIIWNGIFFLMDIGFVILQRLNPYLAQKQIIWFFFGFIITLCIPMILKFTPKLELFKYVYLGVGFVLLLSTLLFGEKSGGAINWINIKGITFQPSEIVKILFIFYLASSFSKKSDIKHIILPTIVSSIFVLCLVFQTDLGGALIFFMTFMVMLYISTSNAKLFISGLFTASIASFFAFKIFPHVRTRVAVWQNPWKDIEHGGYQIAQSLFAIGTWGLFGCGLTRGYSGYIPVVEKDFIFSAICEEFGVLFGICVILIFLTLFFRGVKISLHCSSRFLSLISASLTSLLCFQTFLILGGVIKLIPLTGVTLPFISYGGSSIIISLITIGIIQWIAMGKSKK